MIKIKVKLLPVVLLNLDDHESHNSKEAQSSKNSKMNQNNEKNSESGTHSENGNKMSYAAVVDQKVFEFCPSEGIVTLG